MKRFLAPMLALTLLGGCASLSPNFYREEGRKLNGSLPSDLANRVMPEGTFNARAGEDPRVVRRDLVHGMLALSDVECEDYLIGVSVAANNTEAGLGLAGLALSTASAVSTPERSSKLLAQLSALTGTSATALGDTVFAGRDFQVIYSAIQTGRRRDRERLFAQVKNRELDDWGYQSLIAAVTPYHLNCGLTYGLQQITEAVEEQARRQDGGAAPGVAPAPPPVTPAPTR